MITTCNSLLELNSAEEGVQKIKICIKIMQSIHQPLSISPLSTQPSSILQHTHNPSPRLPHRRLNLIRRQRKPITPRIPQLISIRVRSITRNIRVICRATRSSIQRRATRTNCVRSAGNSADGGLRARCDLAVLCVVFCSQVAVVAVGPEDVLPV
jgi:hypothetical protein